MDRSEVLAIGLVRFSIAALFFLAGQSSLRSQTPSLSDRFLNSGDHIEQPVPTSGVICDDANYWEWNGDIEL